MVIDYAIQLPCEPRRQFGGDGLLLRLQHLDGAPGGSKSEEQAARATAVALEAGYELRPLAFHCKKCPANAIRKPFGCFGSLVFPLSVEGEEWLMNLLPQTLDPQDATGPHGVRQIDDVRKLLDLLGEMEINDKLLRERRTVDTWFERTRPAGRNYGSLFRRVRLTMDHVAHLLFFQERVSPRAAEAVCRAFGVWADGPAGSAGLPDVYFTQAPERNEDPSITDLKLFLHALMIGCSLNVAVRTERVETE